MNLNYFIIYLLIIHDCIYFSKLQENCSIYKNKDDYLIELCFNNLTDWTILKSVNNSQAKRKIFAITEKAINQIEKNAFRNNSNKIEVVPKVRTRNGGLGTHFFFAFFA